MNTTLEGRINPPPLSTRAHDFSTVEVDNQVERKYTEKSGPDFKEVLANSMNEIRKKREAIANGDLSSENDEEFFEKLSQQTSEPTEKKNELQKDDFMKLFVTQLKNQDPLNPDDSTEMATKLAQFNSLEQMMNMNKTLESMVTSQNTGRNIQLVSYVGKEITVDGGRVSLKNGEHTKSEFNLKSDATNSSLEIRDASGSLIFEKELGPLEKGQHKFSWDGKTSSGRDLPDGIYTYSINARDINQKPLEVTATSKANVTGVDLKSETGLIFSELGELSFDDIKSVGVAGFQDEAKKIKNKTPMMEDLERLHAEGRLGLNKNDHSAAKDNQEYMKKQVAKQKPQANISNELTNQSTEDTKSKTAPKKALDLSQIPIHLGQQTAVQE